MFKSKEKNWFLITGLGNPGKKYELTRHNAGFMAADKIIDSFGAKKKSSRFKGDLFEAKIGLENVLILKPTTFMNLSGDAVFAVMQYYKIPIENLIVISDDISLAPGKIRIRKNGSHGGHNGLKDISQKLSSNEYKRIKIGVGEKPHPEMDLADHVLSRFKSTELEAINDRLSDVVSASELMIKGKTEEAMNKFN